MSRIAAACPLLIVPLEPISLSFIRSKLVSVAFDLSLNFGGVETGAITPTFYAFVAFAYSSTDSTTC